MTATHTRPVPGVRFHRCNGWAEAAETLAKIAFGLLLVLAVLVLVMYASAPKP